MGDDQQRLTLFDNRAMGTAMYMSPEQWKTTSVDIRADIYSLGCTLYHLLAGQAAVLGIGPASRRRRTSARSCRRLPSGRNRCRERCGKCCERMTAKKPEERYSDPAEVAAALAPFAEGHQLARLVRGSDWRHRRNGKHEGFAKADTLVAKSAESDTRLGAHAGRLELAEVTAAGGAAESFGARWWRRLSRWRRWRRSAGWRFKRRGGASRSKRRAGAAAAAAGGGAICGQRDPQGNQSAVRHPEATGGRRRIAAADECRSIARQTMRPHWRRLEDWLGARKADHDQEAPADSWFINDVRGMQVARSPRSDASRGENYAHRDYFHGQGVDLPKETTDLKPIDQSPHLSAVYRSTSTGH